MNRVEPVEGAYVYVVHPDCERDIRTLAAKEAWREVYRAWRVLRKCKYGARLIIGEIG